MAQIRRMKVGTEEKRVFERRCVALNRRPLLEKVINTTAVVNDFLRKRKIDSFVLDAMTGHESEEVLSFAAASIRLTYVDSGVYLVGENFCLFVWILLSRLSVEKN